MINLFREKHITQIFEVAHQSVAQKIQNIPEHVLMNVAEAELVDEFFQMCILEPLEIDLKNPEVETFMKDIPGSSFPSRQNE